MGVEIVRNSKSGNGLKGFLDKLRKQKPALEVGFLKEKIASIAAWNEFGVEIPVTDKMRGFFAYKFEVHLRKDTTKITIPPRPFMQMTVDEHKREWTELMGKLAKKYHYNMELVFGAMGDIVRDNIRDMISNGTFTPNSSLTVKAKGKNTPLFNTGTMHGSIEYRVKKVGA